MVDSNSSQGGPEAPENPLGAATVGDKKRDERRGYIYLAVFAVIALSVIAAVDKLKPFHTDLERALIIGESTRDDWIRFEAAGGVHNRDSSSFHGHRPFAAMVRYDNSTGTVRSFELRFSAMLSTPNAIRDALDDYCGSSGWEERPNLMTSKGKGRECIVGYVGEDIYAIVLKPSTAQPQPPQRASGPSSLSRAVEANPEPPRTIIAQQPASPSPSQTDRPVAHPQADSGPREEPPQAQESSAGKVDAVLMRIDPPRYPPQEARRCIGGETVVRAKVDRSGKVVDVSVMQSSGNRNLDRSALDSVRRAMFSPASVRGSAVESDVGVPITFTPSCPGTDPVGSAPRDDLVVAEESPPKDVHSGEAQTAFLTNELPYGWQLATISDPDGFTNVRSAPNGSAPIIGRVLEGQRFKVEPSTGDWWKVEVDGLGVGYMHRSRIALERSTGT